MKEKVKLQHKGEFVQGDLSKPDGGTIEEISIDQSETLVRICLRAGLFLTGVNYN